MRLSFSRSLSCLLLGSVLVSLVSRSEAQTLTTLHAFPLPATDSESALIQGSDGKFYGTTQSGGAANEGTVYRIAPSGAGTVLYSFGTKPNDGATPYAALVQGSDGNFYGTTNAGGSQGNGTVFKITPSGVETVLYSFGTNPNDGITPVAALVQGSDGNFYGTTFAGGSQGHGMVFKITPSGTETVLYGFGTNPDDGIDTRSALVQGIDGNFYGATEQGGSHNRGTVFKITASGTETVLYSFGTNPNDGSSSYAALVQGSDGNFYGMTGMGGSQGKGTVFRITPSGAETVLYSFGTNPNDGANPFEALVQGSDGNFYGTTHGGGGPGTVYKITPSGTESVLYSFGTNPNDGRAPFAGLVQGSDGSFYGTTVAGGSNNSGVVYKVTSSGTETVLYSFGNSSDGDFPTDALVQGSDGNFYGTTTNGGSRNAGTVFRITPSGTENVLYSFGTNPNDGALPFGALLQGSDGNFYGTTNGGGSQNKGTVFKITLSGAETVLYNFGTNPNDGFYPMSTLVQGSDGNFYGMTQSGGSQFAGTVFKVTPLGEETVLYSFGTNPDDGDTPLAALIQGSDGNFYGTTYGGGNGGNGTVFKITPAGIETVLHRFGANPDDGAFPTGLVLGSDEKFYGTTAYGGTESWGTVFKITPDGTESVLYNFGANSNDGEVPNFKLIQGSDGNFYGTTSEGGSQFKGTIFKITPSGTETVLYNFGTNPNDGVDPECVLVQGSDGNFYGTTYSAGGNGAGGTVFKLTLTSQLPVASNDQAILVSASPVTIDVLANDSDPLSRPLTVSAVTQPSMGRVQINGNGTITYTPHQSFVKFSGTDSFTYTVSNGSTSATATVTIGNPFYQQKGNFAGTLSNPGGGYMTLLVTNTGNLTGKLRIGNTFYPLKGQFDADGNYSTTVNGKVLSLQMDLTSFAGNPFGNYTIGGSFDGEPLVTFHATYNSVSNPAPEAGAYTVLLPTAFPETASIPSGAGYAILTVKENGSIAIVGALGDGTPFSDGVYLTGSGTPFINQAPLFINLSYKNRGTLTGTLIFEDNIGASDCDASLQWVKPAQIKAGPYQAGFTTTVGAIGSRYAPPPTGALALNCSAATPNLSATLSEPDFVTTITHQATVIVGGLLHTDAITINDPATDGLALIIHTTHGTFNGTFVDPVGGKLTKLQGVIFTKQNRAAGYFVSPNQSGAVTLTPQ